jgi:hypothetical protein
LGTSKKELSEYMDKRKQFSLRVEAGEFGNKTHLFDGEAVMTRDSLSWSLDLSDKRNPRSEIDKGYRND